MIWTDDKIQQLINLYSNTRNEDIANILGTTLCSIRAKAGRLNLKKTQEHKSKMIGKRNKMVGTDITKDLMKETALKYKTRGEFQRLDSSIYTTARVAGVLDEISLHMIKGNYSIPQLILFYIIREIFNDCEVLYNTYDIINPYELDIYIKEHQLALEYDGKHWHKNNDKDIIKNEICLEKNINLIRIVENSRDYIKDIKEQLIENLNILNMYCDVKKEDIIEMEEKNIYYFVSENINDLNDIKKVISNYEYYSDFINKEKSIYQKIMKRGLLKDLTKDLKKERVDWNDELILNEVSKYDNLKDFIEKSHGCYLHCKRFNKTSFLEPLYRRYQIFDLDLIQKTMAEYTYLQDFRKDNPYYYHYLSKNKLLHLTNNLIKHKNRVIKK
jgi:very-short-patch-repair endonuclease